MSGEDERSQVITEKTDWGIAGPEDGTIAEPFEKQSPAIGKVLDLSETITFKTKRQVVYKRDTECCDECRACVFSFLNPVDVHNDAGDRIGFATFSADNDNEILAELFIQRDCPERLDIELGRVFPQVAWCRLRFRGEDCGGCQNCGGCGCPTEKMVHHILVASWHDEDIPALEPAA